MRPNAGHVNGVDDGENAKLQYHDSIPGPDRFGSRARQKPVSSVSIPAKLRLTDEAFPVGTATTQKMVPNGCGQGDHFNSFLSENKTGRRAGERENRAKTRSQGSHPAPRRNSHGIRARVLI